MLVLAPARVATVRPPDIVRRPFYDLPPAGRAVTRTPRPRVPMLRPHDHIPAVVMTKIPRFAWSDLPAASPAPDLASGDDRRQVDAQPLMFTAVGNAGLLASPGHSAYLA